MGTIVSNCCGASEWYTESGICGMCKEHATMYDEDDYDELCEYIGEKILFTYDPNCRLGRKNFVFKGTHVEIDDEGLLLWDDNENYVTLEYARENIIYKIDD